MFENFPPKSVVVGIDGSQAAIRAARWAANEVAGTDNPLQLLYIRDIEFAATRAETRDALATAEAAVYDAYNAVESLGKPVKVEMMVVEARPVPYLINASDSTPLLCIGNTGSGTSRTGFGSTAAQLVHSAHCSVAVVRGEYNEDRSQSRWIVAHVVGSPDDGDTLDRAFEEAERRNAPLVVLTAWQSPFDLLQDDRKIFEHDRRMRAILDRDVAVRTPHFPEVQVRTVTAFGTLLSYLADHAADVEVVIVGGNQACVIQEIVGPTGALALRHSDFTLLVVR